MTVCKMLFGMIAGAVLVNLSFFRKQENKKLSTVIGELFPRREMSRSISALILELEIGHYCQALLSKFS
jgi:hypothetical protein